MAGTDDRDGVWTDATRVTPVDDTAVGPVVEGADGDDITVVPAGAPDGSPRRRSRGLAVGIVSAVLVIAGVALLLRHPDSKSTVVRPGAPATVPAADINPSTTVAHVKSPAVPAKPVVVSTTVPVAASTVPASVPVVVQPPPLPATVPVTAAPTTAPPQQFGASVLTWSGPRTLTIAGGKTASLSVTAHNPTAGIANLPHPLSCTPRLDHGEVCAQMVQQIAPGQSASATYTIDATGVKAGSYTLSIEGVLTINVTVTEVPKTP